MRKVNKDFLKELEERLDENRAMSNHMLLPQPLYEAASFIGLHTWPALFLVTTILTLILWQAFSLQMTVLTKILFLIYE